MNLKYKILFLFVSFLLFNCKNENSKPENEKINKEVKTITDENFETFLKDFNHDSIFQISRVKFPLKVKEIDNENMLGSGLKEKIISKSEYTKLDFTYPKDALTREFDRYTQKNITKNNTCTVEIRGVDNGICSDFYFEKISGKWFLKSWKEQST